MSAVIYTIGYGQLRPDALAGLAESLDVTVVDVRGRPVSRRPGFGRRQLETLLGERYTWRGDTLGGVNHLAGARFHWPSGLRHVMASVQRPMLLCACHAPGCCHRHQLALTAQSTDMQVWTMERGGAPLFVHLFQNEAVTATELQRSIDDGDEYQATIWTTPSDLLREFEGA
jgi:hypothetical protein